MVVASPIPLAKNLSVNSIEENSVLTFNYIDEDPIKERKKEKSFLPIKCFESTESRLSLFCTESSHSNLSRLTLMKVGSKVTSECC